MTAAYNALALHFSTPLHHTHAVLVSTEWDSSISDPVLSWRINKAVPIQHSLLGALLDSRVGTPQTYCVDGEVVPMCETWTQAGLRKYHGPGAEPDGTFLTLVMLRGFGKGASATRLMPYGLDNGGKKEVGDQVWEARNDERWEENYKRRVGLPLMARERAVEVSWVEACWDRAEEPMRCDCRSTLCRRLCREQMMGRRKVARAR